MAFDHVKKALGERASTITSTRVASGHACRHVSHEDENRQDAICLTAAKKPFPGAPATLASPGSFWQQATTVGRPQEVSVLTLVMLQPAGHFDRYGAWQKQACPARGRSNLSGALSGCISAAERRICSLIMPAAWCAIQRSTKRSQDAPLLILWQSCGNTPRLQLGTFPSISSAYWHALGLRNQGASRFTIARYRV